MEIEVTKKLFTVHDLRQMEQAGILHEDERIELIDGEIVQMSPVGRRHTVCVNRANTLFVRALDHRALLSPQNPLRLSDWTMPMPDIVAFKYRDDFYAQKEPTHEDVFFVLEVSDSSLSYDLKVKLSRYASAGIPEYWIADVQNDILRVHRSPTANTYAVALTLGPGEHVSPDAFPDIRFRVEEILTTDFDVVE
jgi:Uma2 family endonuclease